MSEMPERARRLVGNVISYLEACAQMPKYPEKYKVGDLRNEYRELLKDGFSPPAQSPAGDEVRKLIGELRQHSNNLKRMGLYTWHCERAADVLEALSPKAKETP